jgi:hypothetical protein
MAANAIGYKSADDGSAGLGGERRHHGFVGAASGDALDSAAASRVTCA